MSIILKYILRNIKEKKLRSLLIIVSLTLSVVVLTLCLTLKDNVLEKYTEFLIKTSGTSDIWLIKDIPFEKEKLEDLSNNYSLVPLMVYDKEDASIVGVNIVDLQKNKMIQASTTDNLKNNEVIISTKTAEAQHLKVNDTINICNTELKIKEIVKPYGLLLGETEEQPVYLVSISMANKIAYNDANEDIKSYFDINKTYITGAYIDVLDDNIEEAKDQLKDIDNNFNVTMVKTSLDDALSQINALMIIMFVITVLIAFYIIRSILKLVLEERNSVIGTFRSIGASKKITNALLYIENSVYALISSVIGIILTSLLIGPVVDSFISVDGLELTSKAQIKPLYILIVVLFTILIQIVITFFELKKNKNRSIKDIIFDTQDTKYQISKSKIVIGFILILFSLIIYLINNNYSFIMGLLPVIFVVIGFTMIMPFIIKLISKFLVIILKNRKTSYLACKNVADNKVLVSSTVLLFIIISMSSLIYNISATISNTYEGFDKVTHYTMRVSNLSKEEEEYKYIKDIDGVKESAFYYINMGYFEIDDAQKVFAIVGYDNQDDTVFKLYDSIDFDKEEADKLKNNEILLDEAFAVKNNYKVGDKVKINGLQFFDEDYYFKVKGYIDSTNTTSMRTVGMISKDMYNKIFKENYKTILIDSDLPDDVIEENLKEAIKEDDAYIVSYQDWIGSDKESTKQIMNIVYGILSLGILLAMVGLINNGLVSYIQRKRGFAVLNSTCMTKFQLYKMSLEENIFSFIIAVIPGIILSIILNLYMIKMLNSMSMFVNVVFEAKGVLILLGVIFILTIAQTIVSVKKIRKLDLVKEIKYE